jgi:hypothetical protein
MNTHSMENSDNRALWETMNVALNKNGDRREIL